jgi:hypothetical protein
MAKTKENPVEQMKLDIEFADNGIILRNPEIEDEVTLALTGSEMRESGYDYGIDHSQEYRAIGKKIYDWLTEVAITEHADRWITTGANLHIKAELTGRPKE